MTEPEYEYGLNPGEEPGLVYIKTGAQGDELQIRHGQTELYIKASAWTPVKGDGFLVGDQVQVLSRDGANTARIARISRMEWHIKLAKIIYTLQSRTQTLTKRYFIQDLSQPVPLLPESSNPELEASIQNDPDDHEAWAVYADWLQSIDDPRGEMIALERAFQAKRNNPQLIRRRQDLLQTHQEREIWELHKAAGLAPTDYPGIKLEWFAGFLKKANVLIAAQDAPHKSREKIIALILSSRLSKFLMEFRVEKIDNNLITLLTEGGPRPALHKLSLEGKGDIHLDQIFLRTPNLKYLKLSSSTILSRKLSHTELRILILNLRNDSLSFLTNAHLPKLGILRLKLTHYVPALNKHLKALTKTGFFPQLKSLQIHFVHSINIHNNKEIFKTIFPSPLTDQLETLEIQVSYLHNRDARYFIKHQKALEHLKQLIILYHSYDETALIKLKETFDKRLVIKYSSEKITWENFNHDV